MNRHILCTDKECNVSARPDASQIGEKDFKGGIYYEFHYHRIDEETVIKLLDTINRKEKQLEILREAIHKANIL